MATRKNIIGLKFNKLLVIERRPTVVKNKQWKSMYLCRCDCGVEKDYSYGSIVFANSKSCGCNNFVRELQHGEQAFRRTLRYYKRNAKNRGKLFSLTGGQFRELSKMNCFYCNQPPSNVCSGESRGNEYGDFIYNGLDRLDSGGDYTFDNCVPCCRRCNVAKNDMTFNEFIDWVGRVGNNLIEKNISKAS